MDKEFKCSECDYTSWYKGGLTYHKREEHKKYGIAGRCQAYLLTPSARRWNKDIRCKSSAKSLVMPFCGNHDQLSKFIEEVVWREA